MEHIDFFKNENEKEDLEKVIGNMSAHRYDLREKESVDAMKKGVEIEHANLNEPMTRQSLENRLAMLAEQVRQINDHLKIAEVSDEEKEQYILKRDMLMGEHKMLLEVLKDEKEDGTSFSLN